MLAMTVHIAYTRIMVCCVAAELKLKCFLYDLHLVRVPKTK